MKIAGDLIEVKSSVQAQSEVVMGIRQEDMGHIMGLLAGAYSNKVRAIIREYSTNARDAHVEAGTTRPIEVTLPYINGIDIRPFFSVQDYGTGLTVEDIHSIYAQYGRSTKRDSNAYTGALGIGCKSALAYCSSFTVASVQDGTKIIVSVEREASGAGVMKVVDTVSTDEPNGTLVTVPVARADFDKFRAEAADFFRVWNPDHVLVNGSKPQRHGGLKLSESLYMVETPGVSQVVMGNVAYPAPYLNTIAHKSSIIAYVPLGAVGFPPSREALDDTKHTQATLERIAEDYRKGLLTAIQREVNAAPTPAEAVKRVLHWWPFIQGNKPAFTYKGAELPSEFKLPAVPVLDLVTGDPGLNPDGTPQTYHPDFRISHNHSGRLSSSYTTNSWSLDNWPKTVWVYNYSPAKFNADHKKKLRRWAAASGLGQADYRGRIAGIEHWLMLEGPAPTSPFIDPARCVDWEDVRKIQLVDRALNVGVQGRIPGSYDTWIEGTAKRKGEPPAEYQHGVPGDKIRRNVPIFYVHGNQRVAKRHLEALAFAYPKFTLVCLSANRIEKFCRIVPESREVIAGIKEAAQEWAKSLTADQRLAMHQCDKGCRDILAMLDGSKVKDPALRGAIRVANIPVTELHRKRAGFGRNDVFNRELVASKWTNPLRAYPLVTRDAIKSAPDHVYRYINAEFSA